MRLRSTLRRTLSLHFLLVTIVPLLIFGTVAVSLLHKHLQSGIYERNRMLSREIANSTEQFLREIERDLTVAAHVMAAGTIVGTNNIDAYLEELVKSSDGSLESIYLVNGARQVVSLGLNMHAGLNREDYRGVDFSRHALFRQHPVISRPVWSDPFISLATGHPSVTLALPSGDRILLGNVSLQRLSEQLARFTPESGDECAIVDHTGTLVASSVPDLASQQVNLRYHAGLARTTPDSRETVTERHEGRLFLENTAEIKYAGWFVWVSVDMGKKLAPVEHIRNLQIGIMLLALLLAGGIALLDARRLLQPLSTLSERAVQIGAGVYNVQPDSSGFTEIDSLAASLQQMSQAIRDREASLVASEQRFRTLVNSIDGIVWEMEVVSGCYLFVSEQSKALLGYAPAQWLADPEFWADHVHALDRERVVSRGRTSLGFNGKADLEYRFVTADGRSLWFRDLITVVWDGDEPAQLLGVMIDVTDRKVTEVELEHYRLHLEELVAQRTAELQAAQQELVRKERLAVLGQLTATVSHEIRNPLGTVANSLYLLREMLGNRCLSKVERPLALAERSVQRCDGIISELLDFTRQRELRREPLVLDAWLAGMLDEMLWPDSVSRHWQLTSGVTVMADPERLRRALVNVITNAVQAMEAKPPQAQRLEIVTRRRDGRCEIVVSDSGTGIPAEIHHRIFEPLFSTKNFGVGLGVPIICKIMADHGGGVDYQSTVGEGTTVTLWLPLDPPPGTV